jgi:hypothetical protein
MQSRLCLVIELELALLLFITISQKNQHQNILTFSLFISHHSFFITIQIKKSLQNKTFSLSIPLSHFFISNIFTFFFSHQSTSTTVSKPNPFTKHPRSFVNNKEMQTPNGKLRYTLLCPLLQSKKKRRELCCIISFLSSPDPISNRVTKFEEVTDVVITSPLLTDYNLNTK